MNVDSYIQSFKTATDLSGQVHKFVRMTAPLTVGVHTALAQVSVGVLQNKPTSGQTADVAVNGRTPVYGSGIIASGNKVAPTAAGLARVAASGDHVAGIAITDSDGTAAQPMVDILVTLGGAPLP